MKIRINTNVPGTCQPCEIVPEDTENFDPILPQTDWEYPSIASSFGWSLQSVQPKTGHCEEHEGDGTVTCTKCGCTASDFISAAYDFLAANDGLEIDDPGYFEMEG